MRSRSLILPVCLAIVQSASTCAKADQTLEVGPGHAFARIEHALAEAKPGDTILVHPLEDGLPYVGVALLVRTPRLRIAAASHERVRLDGEGTDYSGSGSIPRALVQFDPGADNCTIEGFDLARARNRSHNGAGIRINQANNITVLSCTIHHNDMGVMSNGHAPDTAVNQRLERCLIYANGSPERDGMSHNLYLGGTSATISACEVHSSTSGHNIKSRAHYTRIEYCWVHDSANRELDLVDADDTELPDSDAIVLGSILHKAPDLRGNRTVIHFGQDGGRDHTGTLTITNSTIITPYISPVIAISAPGSNLRMVNTLISDAESGQRNQVVVGWSDSPGFAPRDSRAHLSHNAFFGDFVDASGLRPASPLRFANPPTGDYGVGAETEVSLASGLAILSLRLPSCPGRAGDTPGVPLSRYAHPQSSTPREDDDAPLIGAWPPQSTPAPLPPAAGR